MAVGGLLRDVTVGASLDVGWFALAGIDAEQRISNDESAEVVVLAHEAMERLARRGAVVASTMRPLARSATAIAVPLDADPGPLDERALATLVASAGRLVRSTGPSGLGIVELLARWGLRDVEVVVAPPGLPVATLIADGIAPLGFQQRSELVGHPVRILPMPASCAIVTTFTAAAVRHLDVAKAVTLIDALVEAVTPSICARHEFRPVTAARPRTSV